MNSLVNVKRLQATSRTTAGLPVVILAALLGYGVARLVVAGGGSLELGMAVGLLISVPVLLGAEVALVLRTVTPGDPTDSCSPVSKPISDTP